MEQRQPAEDIISWLATTSAKIRALAEAGYDRTEISQVLDIRYQHVRKVLLNGGITDGLRRQVAAEREPILRRASTIRNRCNASKGLCDDPDLLIGGPASPAARSRPNLNSPSRHR
jgi:hypothetical protein